MVMRIIHNYFLTLSLEITILNIIHVFIFLIFFFSAQAGSQSLSDADKCSSTEPALNVFFFAGTKV
jgi:hypothetical protein